VVALAVGQTEEAFLENGVAAIPQGQGEAEPLLVFGQAGEAVLAPAVGPGAGLIVGEVVPGVAAPTVILAHGAPLTFAQSRASSRRMVSVFLADILTFYVKSFDYS
jgi:hypothetical protein